MSETRRLAAILAADVVGYSRLMGDDEAGTARAVREHREAATPIVRGFGGRLVKTMGDGVLLGISVCRRGGRVRDSHAAADGRAQRGRSRGRAHPLPHRRQSRRRADRRRGYSGRRRQYRGAARGHLRAGRRMHLRIRLRSCAWQDRGRVRRPRRQGAQEHRPARAGLRAWGRRHRLREGLDACGAHAPEAPFRARAARRRARGAAGCDRGRRVVAPRCEPARKRRCEGARRGRAAFDRRAALRQSVGRSGAGLPRRRPDRRTDHQLLRASAAPSSSRATRP